MFVPRIVKYSWKELFAIAFFVMGFAMTLYQLYRGWAYHVIDVPLPPYRPWVASLARQPMWFALGVAFFGLFSILIPFVLWLLTWGLFQEQRGFRVRDRRPPLEDAIRQPFDQH